MNVHPGAQRIRRPVSARPGVPTRPLMVLTLAVLSLHATLLQFAPARFNFDEPMKPPRFIARGVVLQPFPAAPVALPVPRAAAAPIAVKNTRAAAPPGEPGAPSSAPAIDTAGSAPVPSLANVPEPAASALPTDAPIAVAPAPFAVLPAPGASVASAQAPAAMVAAAPAQAIAPANADSHTVSIAAPPAMSGEASQRPAPLLIPGSIRLTYRVAAENRGLPMSASAELLWLHDGRSYEARFSVGNLLRTRVQTSRGAIGSQGLMPTRFADKSGSERAAHFERAADGQGGHVVFSANSPIAPLAPGAQDRLSVLLQLAAMLAGDPARYGTGSAISLQVIGAREADIWVFKVEGMELLELPQGRAQTVKLTRNPRRDYDQMVEVWLGVAMGYLPARIRITEPNGNSLDQTLEKLDRP